jgi:hypothetical protein
MMEEAGKVNITKQLLTITGYGEVITRQGEE